MSEESKRLRAKMKQKAESLATAKVGKVDCSDWSPDPEPTSSGQVGKRPTGRQGFKAGGKVSGEEAKMRADKAPRGKKLGGGATMGILGGLGPAALAGAFDGKDEKKNGGRAKRAEGGQIDRSPPDMNDYAERPAAKNAVQQRMYGAQDAKNNKLANKAFEMFRQSDNMMKKGGRAKKAEGGFSTQKDSSEDMSAADQARAAAASKAASQKAQEEGAHGRKAGGRTARKDGGRTKKPGTNVNIIISAGGKQAAPDASGGQGPVKPPMPPLPTPPMGMPAGGPPMGAGAMPPGPPMPPPGMNVPPPSMMGRKAGGRVRSYKDMDAGAGSGKGRLEKVEIQKSK